MLTALICLLCLMLKQWPLNLCTTMFLVCPRYCLLQVFSSYAVNEVGALVTDVVFARVFGILEFALTLGLCDVNAARSLFEMTNKRKSKQNVEMGVSNVCCFEIKAIHTLLLWHAIGTSLGKHDQKDIFFYHRS